MNVIRDVIFRNPTALYNNPLFLRRNDIANNLIDIDLIEKGSKPTFQRIENDEKTDSETNESTSNESTSASDEKDNNNAAEESVESTVNDLKSKQISESNDKGASDENDGDASDDDYDSDEPPGGGDGQGGGVLGLLAGLSGGVRKCFILNLKYKVTCALY